MDGLLFDSAFDAGPRANTGCSSVNDLQQRLHASLAAKSSDTRCEHVDMTFELRHSTVFDLTADHEANAPDESDPMHQVSQQLVTRTVTALETTQEQPSDDPVLQKAVAKFIIARIGLVDGSSWAVREISRGVQGWTFTYLCKQSLQFWNRANAKNSDRPPIANYSMNLPFDHINLSRPAFDCHGTVTIAFIKSTRAILVKYGHTPLHKTVADLVELYPIRLPPTPTAPNARTPKAKRPPPAEGEEGSRRKKAKKKPADTPGQGDGAEPVSGEAAEAGESAGQPPATEEQGAKKKRPRKKSTKATKAQEPAALAETPAGDQQPGTVQAAPTESPHEETPASQTAPTAVNLRIPPAEAERRKQHANNMLRSKDIDPATLSVEQFNIFANQAPTLQEASLEMLAKYGAERLRIVHPDNGGSSGSGGAEQAASKNSTPGQSQIANPTPSGTADPSASQTPVPLSREAQPAQDAERPGVSIGDGAVVSMQQNGDVGTTESTLLPNGRKRKTRGSCENCKANKAKCTKEHPACSVCQQKGEQCFYAPPKPRKKSINPQGGDQEATQTEESLAANGGDEPGQGLGTFSTPQKKPSRRKPKKTRAADPPVPDPAGLEQESPTVPVSESQQYDNSSAFSTNHRPSVDAREHHVDPQPAAAPESDNEEFYPDPNILNHHHSDNQVFNSHNHHSDNQVFNSHNHHPGLSFLHQEPTQAQPHAPTGQPDLRETANTAGHELPPSQPTQSNPAPEPSFTDQSPYLQAHHNPVQRHQAATSRPSPRTQNAVPSPKSQRKKSTGARHSLPTKQAPVASPAPVPSAQPMQQPSVQSTPQHGYQPPAQQPVPPPAQPAVQEPTHQSVQPTVQHLIQQPTQPPVRRSPHQAKAVTARTQSRQGHRSQNTTPVTQTPLAQPPSQPSNVSYNATDTYDPFSRYDQGHSQFPTSTGNEQGHSRMNYDTNASYTPTSSAKGTTNSPAYDFQRTRNPLNSALDTSGGYGTQRNSSRGQWPVSQAGGTQASSNSPYTMASASASGSSGAAESYGGQAGNQSATSYQPQPQQSTYGNSYGTTQSQPHQATTSHSTQSYYGYGQNQTTPSGGSSNSGGVMNQGGFHGQSRGYAMPPSADPGPYQPHRSPNVPQANTYAGHGYGSADEQGLYELLRASGTGHQ